MLYSRLMTTLSGALADERELKEEQERGNKGKGKTSVTEDYLNATGGGNSLVGNTPKQSSSPDSLAAVPGLIRPRKTIRRGT